MARQYYFLVASLKEYAPEADNKDFDIAGLKEYVRENLKPDDQHSLDLLYSYYDIENIISIVSLTNRFNGLGNFSIDELQDQVKKPDLLPPYLARVIEAYNNVEASDDDQVDVSRRLERSLYEAFYNEAGKSKNRFLRQWFEFDRTLRNVCAAVVARNRKYPVEDAVVGDDPIATALAHNTSADFGLKGELDYIDTVISALTEETNVLEKERKLDALRWNTVEEFTQFNYFDMDAVLAYMVKANIVYRWLSLDANTGRQMFDQLLSSLSGTELFEWIDRKTEEEL